LAFYALGNGALFLSPKYLPAATTSLLLGPVPVVALLGGIIWLRETPRRKKWVGIGLALIGTFLFFAHGLAPGEPLGLAIGVIGALGGASLSVLGRPLARGIAARVMTPNRRSRASGRPALIVHRSGDGGRAAARSFRSGDRCLAGHREHGVRLHPVQACAAHAHRVRGKRAREPLATVEAAIGARLFLAEPLIASQIIGMIIMVSGVILIQST
jgi:drug/metabolite transporter (DMT)-like permease